MMVINLLTGILKKMIFPIIIIIAIFYLIEPSGNSMSEKCFEMFNLEIKGVVTKIYIDKLNKQAFTYFIYDGKDSRKFTDFHNHINEIETLLSVGDSFYKPSKSFINHIFKKCDKNKEIIVKATDEPCDSLPDPIWKTFPTSKKKRWWE